MTIGRRAALSVKSFMPAHPASAVSADQHIAAIHMSLILRCKLCGPQTDMNRIDAPNSNDQAPNVASSVTSKVRKRIWEFVGEEAIQQQNRQRETNRGFTFITRCFSEKLQTDETQGSPPTTGAERNVTMRSDSSGKKKVLPAEPERRRHSEPEQKPERTSRE